MQKVGVNHSWFASKGVNVSNNSKTVKYFEKICSCEPYCFQGKMNYLSQHLKSITTRKKKTVKSSNPFRTRTVWIRQRTIKFICCVRIWISFLCLLTKVLILSDNLSCRKCRTHLVYHQSHTCLVTAQGQLKIPIQAISCQNLSRDKSC